MANRLIHEQSPYLLQHAHNPVDWFPWGWEAFNEARRLNKPVFLSVGYATCHWCHVMERESFEDPQTAAVLNESFICIKVDREERPDIDTVYMAACQMIAGSGGWPLNVLLTPDKKPFFAATYIPRQSMLGRPGLIDLCRNVTALYQNEPRRIQDAVESIFPHLKQAFEFTSQTSNVQPGQLLVEARSKINQRFDDKYGGFDRAPKFPMPHRLLFLMNQADHNSDDPGLQYAGKTLTAMRLGGLWDHVGFGFHRYATDREWLVPHFEKMLYDQALLVLAYLEGYLLTGHVLFARTVREILAYVLREMTDSEGGFYSAQDADSEGQEGKFYVWTEAEFEQIAAAQADSLPWKQMLGIAKEGNFLDEATRRKTGLNIMRLDRSMEAWAAELNLEPDKLWQQWDNLRQALFRQRAGRIRPLLDDKILTDWNGLMIAALSRAGSVLKEEAYIKAALRAAEFISRNLMDQDRHLLHRWRRGQAAIEATANDYAFLIMGILALSQASGKTRWLDHALKLQQDMNALFWDQAQGGFFLTGVDQKELPVRPKELYDGAIPSANAVALHNLIGLTRMDDDRQWRTQARQLMEAFAGSVKQQPMAYTHTLHAWSLMTRNGRQTTNKETLDGC